MNQNLQDVKENPSLRREIIMVVLAATMVIGSYLWSVNSAVGKWTSRSPDGYYGLLTDALLAGQLHFKREPDPRLSALENPYAGDQGIPRIHDATLFNGHYYLYFGVTPVLLIFGPWRLLTGTFLTEGVATSIFAIIGLLLCTRLWLRLKRDLYPELSPIWTALGVLVIGWGNYVFFLLQNSTVYNVPIAAAFACLMLAFNAAELAFNTAKSERKGLYMGLASFAWALTAGARPNYVLGLPLFGILALILWQRTGREIGFRKRSTFRILFWAIVPAATVGAALAWYNYMRFGDIFEFGVKYQLASSDQRFLSLTSLDNIPATLINYLFAGAYYSSYFPFIRQKADVIGVLVWAPFAAVGVFYTYVISIRQRWRESSWKILGAVFLGTVLIHLASLCLLPFANDRYVVDFLPTAILLAVATAGFLSVAIHGRPLVLRVLFLIFVVGLAGVTVAQSVLFGVQRLTSKSIQHWMASVTDYPARWWEQWLKIEHGPIELQIVFPELIPEERQPLVVSGMGRDVIYIQSIDRTSARFGFFHQGSGGPLGDPIEIEPGRKYKLVVDTGALYPPAEHPLFRGWDISMVEAVRRRLDVHLDDKPVLHWTSSFYPTDPFDIYIGRNPGPNITTPLLSATILSSTRAGMPSPDSVASLPGDGPVRLTVKFPPFELFRSQPLVSTGRPGAGDLIYVSYLSERRLRLGHDSWEGGNVETMDIDYDPNKEHIIEVDMGSLHRSATGLKESKNRLQLRFDGELVISTFRPFHPSSIADLSIGFNTTESSASSNFFTGPLLRAERLPDFTSEPADVKRDVVPR